jgi:hypothetical protein
MDEQPITIIMTLQATLGNSNLARTVAIRFAPGVLPDNPSESANLENAVNEALCRMTTGSGVDVEGLG